MRKHISKKTAAVATVLTLGTGAAAFAYWTTTGNGDGSAKTGTSSPFVVTVDKVSDVLLTPGGPSQTINFTITNNSTGLQHLTSVAASVANADGSAWGTPATCSADDYEITNLTYTPGDVAKDGGTTSGSFKVSLINRAVNQDACKNVTVPLYVAAS